MAARMVGTYSSSILTDTGSRRSHGGPNCIEPVSVEHPCTCTVIAGGSTARYAKIANDTAMIVSRHLV